MLKSILIPLQAFESPLLTDVNSNSSGRDLANTVGEVRVRYGATHQYGMPEKTKIAFANPIVVKQPESESILGFEYRPRFVGSVLTIPTKTRRRKI